MKFRNICVAVFGCAAIMGCSSGSSDGTTSIFAGNEVIVPGDYIGKTFPVRYIGARESGSVELLRGTGSVRIITEDIVELTVGGRTYTLTYDTTTIDGDEYSGTNIFALISQDSPEIVTGVAEDLDSLYAGVYGFETSPDDLPDIDGVRYIDPEGSELLATDGIDVFSFEIAGGVDLTVNFAGGTVTGDVYSSGEFALTLEGGAISGNGFTGTLSASDTGSNIALSSSDVDGTFFGSEAVSLFGSFEGEFAAPVGPENLTGFVGGFLTEKSDL